MSMTRRNLGRRGEEIAQHYLYDQGYKLLHTNWRCKSGEIDIIAHCDDRIIFVEVRTRTSSSRYGTAAESVDARKQERIRLTAQYFLAKKKWLERSVRFDVIAIEVEDTTYKLNHIEGAF